jgi:transposase InsO family protein
MESDRVIRQWSTFVNGQLERENLYLRAQLEWIQDRIAKRPHPSDDERAVLARAAAALDKRRLGDTFNFFSPHTLLNWYRRLIARKWDYSQARRWRGRPSVERQLEEWACRMAAEDPGLGYKGLAGKLANLGFKTNPITVRNILRRNGIPTSPSCGDQLTWGEFLDRHWAALTGADFLTHEVLTPKGLVTYYILILIRLSTREVHVAGMTPYPGEEWMRQVARNLTMEGTGFLKAGMQLLHDRSCHYCPSFRRILQEAGIQTLMLPYQSPDLNAHAERFIRTLKEQCLSRLIITSESMLRHVIRQFVDHYHTERNHQGLGNIIPFPKPEVRNINRNGTVIKESRLGGLLNYYYRSARKLA